MESLIQLKRRVSLLRAQSEIAPSKEVQDAKLANALYKLDEVMGKQQTKSLLYETSYGSTVQQNALQANVENDNIPVECPSSSFGNELAAIAGPNRECLSSMNYFPTSVDCYAPKLKRMKVVCSDGTVDFEDVDMSHVSPNVAAKLRQEHSIVDEHNEYEQMSNHQLNEVDGYCGNYIIGEESYLDENGLFHNLDGNQRTNKRYHPERSRQPGNGEGHAAFKVYVKPLPKDPEALRQHVLQQKLIADQQRKQELSLDEQINFYSRVDKSFPMPFNKPEMYGKGMYVDNGDFTDSTEPWKPSEQSFHNDGTIARSTNKARNSYPTRDESEIDGDEDSLHSANKNGQVRNRRTKAHTSRMSPTTVKRQRRPPPPMNKMNFSASNNSSSVSITEDEVRLAYEQMQLPCPEIPYNEMCPLDQNLYRFMRRRLMNKKSARQSRLRRKQQFENYEATIQAQRARIQSMTERMRHLMRCLINAVIVMSLQSIPLMSDNDAILMNGVQQDGTVQLCCSDGAGVGCGGSEAQNQVDQRQHPSTVNSSPQLSSAEDNQKQDTKQPQKQVTDESNQKCFHCQKFKVFSNALLKAVSQLENQFYGDSHGLSHLLVSLGFCGAEDPLHELFQQQQQTLTSILHNSEISDLLSTFNNSANNSLSDWKINLIAANAIRSAWFLFVGPTEQAILFRDRHQILKLIDRYSSAGKNGEFNQNTWNEQQEDCHNGNLNEFQGSVVNDLFYVDHTLPPAVDSGHQNLLVPFDTSGTIDCSDPTTSTNKHLTRIIDSSCIYLSQTDSQNDPSTCYGYNNHRLKTATTLKLQQSDAGIHDNTDFIADETMFSTEKDNLHCLSASTNDDSEFRHID